MAQSSEQGRALQEELQVWMEKNDLAADAKWLTPEEFYGDKRKAYDPLPRLVLISEKAYDVTCDWDGIEAPLRPDAGRVRNEFRAIVKRHGFEYDFEDGPVLCFRCVEEAAAVADADAKSRRETLEWIDGLLARGWKWSETKSRVLVDPADPDLEVFHNPLTDQVLLSPKLVEELKKRVRDDRCANAGNHERDGGKTTVS